MELEEWWNSNSAKDCWAQGFRNAPTPSDDDFKHLILSTTSAFPDQLTAELQLKEITGYLVNSFWHGSTRLIAVKLTVMQTILRRLKQQSSSRIHPRLRPQAGTKKASGSR